MLKNIGTKIREVRKHRGMTLQRLSELTKMSVGDLSRVETGKRNITVLKLEVILEQLNLKLEVK